MALVNDGTTLVEDGAAIVGTAAGFESSISMTSKSNSMLSPVAFKTVSSQSSLSSFSSSSSSISEFMSSQKLHLFWKETEPLLSLSKPPLPVCCPVSISLNNLMLVTSIT